MSLVLQSQVAGSFLGFAAEWWLVLATLAGPIVAAAGVAWYGLREASKKLRNELGAQDARRCFLDNGLDKLAVAFEQALGATRLNYHTCKHLLKVFRDIPAGTPISPRPEDLRSLETAIVDPTVFSAIGPASRIIDAAFLGHLATVAFARLSNINLTFLVEVWLPIRGHYAQQQALNAAEATEAYDSLMVLLQENYHDAERFGKLPRLLADASVRAREMHFASFSDFWKVRRDDEIARLRSELEALKVALDDSSPPSASPES